MNANDYLDIIQASTMCGEDSDCEGCPFETSTGDCHAATFENGLYDKALWAFGELRDELSRTRIRETATEPEEGQKVVFQVLSGMVYVGEYSIGYYKHLHGKYCSSVVVGWTEIPAFPREVGNILFKLPEVTP